MCGSEGKIHAVFAIHLASCLIGALAGILAAVPARAEAARDLMGRVPSVSELVEALRRPSQTWSCAASRPGGTASRPAVDLEVRFEFDSARLTPMARAVLDNLGTALSTDLAPTASSSRATPTRSAATATISACRNGGRGRCGLTCTTSTRSRAPA